MAKRGAWWMAVFVAACGLDPAPRRQPLATPDAGEVDAGEVEDAGPPPDRVVLGSLFVRLTERFDCGGIRCGRYLISFTFQNRGQSDVETLSSLRMTLGDTAIPVLGSTCSDAPWLVTAQGSADVELRLEYLSSEEVRVHWPCGDPQEVDVSVPALPEAPDHGFFSVRATGRFVGGAPFGTEATGHIADVTP